LVGLHGFSPGNPWFSSSFPRPAVNEVNLTSAKRFPNLLRLGTSSADIVVPVERVIQTHFPVEANAECSLQSSMGLRTNSFFPVISSALRATSGTVTGIEGEIRTQYRWHRMSKLCLSPEPQA
jgi:hypothetical protein